MNPATMRRSHRIKRQNKRRSVALSSALLCSLSFLLLSCKPSTRPGTAPTPAAETAAGPVSEIRVSARTEPWPGDPSVKSRVLPVRVRLENGSGFPMLIRYKNLALVGSRGERFDALPAFPIEAKAGEPAVPGVLPRLSVLAYPPVQKPGFQFRDFRVAPFLKPLYPTLSEYEGSFPYDHTY